MVAIAITYTIMDKGLMTDVQQSYELIMDTLCSRKLKMTAHNF